MKLRISLGLVLLLAAFCEQPLALRADGLVRDGVGPISTGRGGTNLGFADNAAIILDNPGALVNVLGDGLAEAGVDTAITSVHYTNPFNDVHSKIRPLPAPVLGYVKKSEDERWAWGIGAFAPAGFGASYGVMNNPVTGPSLYRSIGALGKILPALSYRVNDRLSIGGTVGMGFCDVELDGPFFLQTGPLAGVPAILDLQGLGFAPTGSVGLQYQLTPNTVLGACYTEQTNFDLRGRVQAVLLPGFVLPSDFNSKLHLKWPRSVAVGLKHNLCPHRRISIDLYWYDWAHAFDSLTLELSNPSNPAVAPILNSVGASLPVRDSFPMNWRNSISPRFGYEFDWTDLDTFRTGYVYHGATAPDSTLNPYLDGILEHAFSLGYSRKLPRGAILNLAYQYNFSSTHHVGVSSIVGGDFNNSSMNAQAHFAMISLSCPF